MKRAGDVPTPKPATAKRPKPKAQQLDEIEKEDVGSSREQTDFLDKIADTSIRKRSIFAPGAGNTPIVSLPPPRRKLWEFDNWINSLAEKRGTAWADYRMRRSLPVIQVPQNEPWFKSAVRQLEKNETIERHARLLTGLSDDKEDLASQCGGTYKVAEWIHRCIVSEKVPFYLSSRLNIPHDRIPGVLTRLAKLAPHINFLQEMRELTKLSMVGELTGAYSSANWKTFRYLCGLSVLSRLRETGLAIVPADFYSINTDPIAKQKTSFGLHATTVVIKRGVKRDSFEVNHFETNRQMSKKIKKTSLLKKRTSDANSLQSKQRHWQFSPNDFDSEDEWSPIDHGGSKPKIFTRTSGVYNFSSHEPCDDDFIFNATLENDLRFVSEVLFLNQVHTAGELDHMTNLQLKMMGDLHEDKQPYFPRQRMHSIQETASCELKSSTVAACYLLDDELSYQALIGILIEDSISEFGNIEGNTYTPLLSKLREDQKDVIKRIEEALSQRDQPL